MVALSESSQIISHFKTIIKKPLINAPKRLQRMLLRLQKYDISLTYVPGCDMLLADTLSRAYLQNGNKSQTELETECVNMVEYVPVSAERMDKIRTATQKDSKLQILIKRIQNGWPDQKKDVPVEITQYYDELSTRGGLVFRGESCDSRLTPRGHPPTHSLFTPGDGGMPHESKRLHLLAWYE